MNNRLFLRSVVICILLAALSACSLSKPSLTSADLVGTWAGKSSDGQPTDITFGSDGQFSIRVGNETGTGTYTADFSFTPAHLDVVGDWMGGESVHTIIDFVDRNKIRFQDVQPGDPRPAVFDDKAIIFARK